jgi:hypothetical protein
MGQGCSSSLTVVLRAACLRRVQLSECTVNAPEKLHSAAMAAAGSTTAPSQQLKATSELQKEMAVFFEHCALCTHNAGQEISR